VTSEGLPLRLWSRILIRWWRNLPVGICMPLAGSSVIAEIVEPSLPAAGHLSKRQCRFVDGVRRERQDEQAW